MRWKTRRTIERRKHQKEGGERKPGGASKMTVEATKEMTKDHKKENEQIIHIQYTRKQKREVAIGTLIGPKRRGSFQRV